jgi:hypothetical protein
MPQVGKQSQAKKIMARGYHILHQQNQGSDSQRPDAASPPVVQTSPGAHALPA